MTAALALTLVLSAAGAWTRATTGPPPGAAGVRSAWGGGMPSGADAAEARAGTTADGVDGVGGVDVRPGGAAGVDVGSDDPGCRASSPSHGPVWHFRPSRTTDPPCGEQATSTADTGSEDPGCRASRPSHGPVWHARPSRTTDPPCGEQATAAVVRIVDGDTVILRMSGHPALVRVRLIGVDAPETWRRHDCFGAEATRALRRLLPSGSPVHTARDTELHDRYGRLLLYLWTAGKDGHRHGSRNAFVNAELIRAGFARTMTVHTGTSRAPALHEAELIARHTHAGLWQACENRQGSRRDTPT